MTLDMASVQGMQKSTEERRKNVPKIEISLAMSHPIQMMEIHRGL